MLWKKRENSIADIISRIRSGIDYYIALLGQRINLGSWKIMIRLELTWEGFGCWIGFHHDYPNIYLDCKLKKPDRRIQWEFRHFLKIIKVFLTITVHKLGLLWNLNIKFRTTNLQRTPKYMLEISKLFEACVFVRVPLERVWVICACPTNVSFERF